MVTIATGPTGLSRAARLGGALGSGLEKGFVPAFQQRTEDLNKQKEFAPILEALRATIGKGGEGPGPEFIKQITADPNIFSQVMEDPNLGKTILSMNQAAVGTDPQLTGFSKLDEITRTFAAAQKAALEGDDERAKILFAHVDNMAGIKGHIDPDLDLVHLFRKGSDVGIPVQLNPKGGGIQDLEGNKLTLEEGDRLAESLTISGSLEGVMGGIEQRMLRDAQASATNFIRTAAEALQLMKDEPFANTITGKAVALLGDLKAEAKAVAKIFGLNFEESQLDPDTYISEFKGLKIASHRMRSMITSMAFQAAAAAGQRTNSVSNRDIVRFIQAVGGAAGDDEAFAAVLRDEAKRTAENFKTSFRIRNKGKEFEGNLGLDALDGADTSGAPITAESLSNVTTEDILKRL